MKLRRFTPEDIDAVRRILAEIKTEDDLACAEAILRT